MPLFYVHSFSSVSKEFKWKPCLQNYKKYKAGKVDSHFFDGFEHFIFIAFSSRLTEETRYFWADSVFGCGLFRKRIFFKNQKVLSWSYKIEENFLSLLLQKRPVLLPGLFYLP